MIFVYSIAEVSKRKAPTHTPEIGLENKEGISVSQFSNIYSTLHMKYIIYTIAIFITKAIRLCMFLLMLTLLCAMHAKVQKIIHNT